MALRCVRVARFTLLLISFAVLVAIVALGLLDPGRAAAAQCCACTGCAAGGFCVDDLADDIACATLCTDAGCDIVIFQSDDSCAGGCDGQPDLPTATPSNTPTTTATPKPGHGPLSLEPHSAPVAGCIAKCRSQATTVGDFLACIAICRCKTGEVFCPTRKPTATTRPTSTIRPPTRTSPPTFTPTPTPCRLINCPGEP